MGYALVDTEIRIPIKTANIKTSTCLMRDEILALAISLKSMELIYAVVLILIRIKIGYINSLNLSKMSCYPTLVSLSLFFCPRGQFGRKSAGSWPLNAFFVLKINVQRKSFHRWNCMAMNIHTWDSDAIPQKSQKIERFVTYLHVPTLSECKSQSIVLTWFVTF